MEYCRFCHAELEEGAQRCAQCGQPLDTGDPVDQALQNAKPESSLTRCPACGKEQSATFLFCRECGHPLKALEERAASVFSSEIVLTHGALAGIGAEEVEAPPTLAGGSGLPDVYSEYSNDYWARALQTQLRLAHLGGAPAVPQPPIKRRTETLPAFRRGGLGSVPDLPGSRAGVQALAGRRQDF